MTYDEDEEGWVILVYDDDILTVLDKIETLLEEHSLTLELADGEFDGYQPIRINKT